MAKILISDKEYHLAHFNNEAELEKVVVKNHKKIFGDDTYYFDLKKGIRHRKGDLLTIPDGYLLRFGATPSMTIIENEISTHDPVSHIGVHFLKYNSALTEESKYPVKKFLLQYLRENPKEEEKFEKLMDNSTHRTISDLLDTVVLDQNFDYAIVIDEKTEELERVVRPYGPEIIVLKKYQYNDEIIYHIEGDEEQVQFPRIGKTENTKHKMRKLPGIDTIVCPAQEEGFNEVFLKENRWFAVRIRHTMIPKLKYLAMYEKNPISAIRYIGRIKEIIPYKNTGKFEIVLDGKPQKITPIKLSKEFPNLFPQAPRYTIRSLIDKGRKLEDIFTKS